MAIAMPVSAEAQPPDSDRLETATDHAIAACGSDARLAVKALLVTNEFLEAQIEELQAAVSMVTRAASLIFHRDRKDWYD
jgi:hypothetical protein